MSGPRFVVAGVAAVLVLLLGACGLDTDDEPQAITRPTVEPSPSSEASTVVLPGEDADNVSVWFLTTDDAGTFLREAQRQVALPATPGSRLDALFAQPPDEGELADGLWTAIPPDSTLASRPRQRGHVLVVDLPEGVYDELHGLIAQDAFAQIVFTATEIPGVESVAFRRDGSLFEAVNGEGEASSRPLGRDDFPDLVRIPGVTPETTTSTTTPVGGILRPPNNSPAP